MIRKILTSSLITLIAIGGFFVSIERGNVGNIQFVQVNTAMAGDVATPAPGSAVTPAAAPKTDPATDTDVKKMMNNLVAGLNIILGIVTFIASPAIMLAGWLMSPDWTSGDLFGLRTIMHSLWVTVSNILYFVYAVLLIIIALATMFNQEKFGYKVMLPKLALGIIMVPFTWWFVQWTISLASVVTASVISIPMETIAADNGWWNSQIIPTKIVYDNSS